MRLKLLAVLIFISTSIFFSIVSKGQTSRVSIGRVNGSIEYTEVFEYDYVDLKPEFPGGGQSLLNYINKNRQYPKEAYDEGIQGRVTCSFIVNTDGKLSHIHVLRGVEPSLNSEAVRIISEMPEWIPGEINGHPVPVRVVCAIPFRK